KWQRCNDGGCVDDTDVPVAAMLDIVRPGEPTVAQTLPHGPAAAVAPSDAPPADDGEAQTIWGVIVSGMTWGFITILTPCVFPMLPVTVSFFAKQKGPALPRSLVYAFGIVFTITVIGLIFKSGLDVMARG